MDKKVAPKLNKDQSEALSKLGSTAGKIKYLLDQGFDRGDTSRILGISGCAM